MLMPSIFGENLFDDFFNDFPFYNDRDMKKAEKKLGLYSFLSAFFISLSLYNGKSVNIPSIKFSPQMLSIIIIPSSFSLHSTNHLL